MQEHTITAGKVSVNTREAGEARTAGRPYIISGKTIYKIDFSAGIRDYYARPIYTAARRIKYPEHAFLSAADVNAALHFTLLT